MFNKKKIKIVIKNIATKKAQGKMDSVKILQDSHNTNTNISCYFQKI